MNWPDAPQLHVSGSPVNLSHSAITDGFQVSASEAQAFEGDDPVSAKIVTTNVFSRTIDLTLEGDSYSVLPFSKGTQSSGTVMVQVVRTLDWNTAGIRDMRDRVDDLIDGYDGTDCVIGRELAYPSYADPAGSGTFAGHYDPEGRPGWILSGTAYDGVETEAALADVQNTTDGAVEPAHVRELRQGPILPVLVEAPSDLR